jgi:hypothetical protein
LVKPVGVGAASAQDDDGVSGLQRRQAGHPDVEMVGERCEGRDGEEEQTGEAEESKAAPRSAVRNRRVSDPVNVHVYWS